ncbi:hypothetical protein C8R45DRAFT_943119 [Mycena sanguinolenta]|nr:hypothetical protein C8R45DRAFT_943119 [Mycena sanguinolenta]
MTCTRVEREYSAHCDAEDFSLTLWADAGLPLQSFLGGCRDNGYMCWAVRGDACRQLNVTHNGERDFKLCAHDRTGVIRITGFSRHQSYAELAGKNRAIARPGAAWSTLKMNSNLLFFPLKCLCHVTFTEVFHDPARSTRAQDIELESMFLNKYRLFRGPSSSLRSRTRSTLVLRPSRKSCASLGRVGWQGLWPSGLSAATVMPKSAGVGAHLFASGEVVFAALK